jgi:peptidoglycan/LPS O-acetylase OafA/YrhL
MRRRELIMLAGGAVARPLATRAGLELVVIGALLQIGYVSARHVAEKHTKRIFVCLDALRAIAALCVVLFHLRLWWFHIPLFDHAYLAVDFFFCLSGFVLAHAYGSALRGPMSLRTFSALRTARLYPLLVLATIIGVCAELIRGTAEPDTLWAWALLGALSLPIPGGAGPARQFFPLNWPAWSLFFEVVVNAVMAIAWRRLN